MVIESINCSLIKQTRRINTVGQTDAAEDSVDNPTVLLVTGCMYEDKNLAVIAVITAVFYSSMSSVWNFEPFLMYTKM